MGGYKQIEEGFFTNNPVEGQITDPSNKKHDPTGIYWFCALGRRRWRI